MFLYLYDYEAGVIIITKFPTVSLDVVTAHILHDLDPLNDGTANDLNLVSAFTFHILSELNGGLEGGKLASLVSAQYTIQSTFFIDMLDIIRDFKPVHACLLCLLHLYITIVAQFVHIYFGSGRIMRIFSL